MPDGRDRVRRIADAVLYEGYVLWPYRRSALKNQRRWTFGGVYPEAHSALHPDDSAVMQTQLLVEGDDETSVEVAVRFLHVVRREAARLTADGRLEPVDRIELGEERHVSWDEATEREVRAALAAPAVARTPLGVPIDIPAGRAVEELCEPGGRPAGALVRSWEALVGAVEIGCEPVDPGVYRWTVRITNSSPCSPGDRETALRQTLCSTHTTMHVRGGAFVSQTDPPAGLRSPAEQCENVGTWPVLVGEPGERHIVLSAPIILPDHPEIAPESPGDLFDSGEIDQLLVLSILSMTDEERRAMRESDPRTREILERTESLTSEELMRLHGAIRERGRVPAALRVP